MTINRNRGGTIALLVLLASHQGWLLSQALLAQPASPTDLYGRVAELQRVGSLDEAMSLLDAHLRTNPDDPKAHFAMGLVYLEKHRIEAAASEAELLPQFGAAGAKYAARLRPLIARAQEDANTREQLLSRLTNLDAKGAVEAVDALFADDIERALLRAKLRIYQAQFAGAASAVLPLRNQPETAAIAARFIDEARTAGTKFTEKFERLNWYLSSPLALTSCTPDGARATAVAANFNLLEYVQLASSTFVDYPLNDWSMDIAFHAALISSPYEQSERLGDSILRGRGILKVPFFSSEQRFWLVIDSRARRLYTEEDRRKSINLLGSESLRDSVAFNLAFGEIRALRQSAGSDAVGGFLKSDSYALRLEPAGLAPYYIFMPLIHCLYGEAAQKQITANLGRFLLHVIEPVAPHAQLANPNVRTKDWLGAFSGIMAWGTTLTGVSADAISAGGSGASAAAFIEASKMQARVSQARSGLEAVEAAQRRSRQLYAEATAQSVGLIWQSLESERTSREIATLLSPPVR